MDPDLETLRNNFQLTGLELALLLDVSMQHLEEYEKKNADALLRTWIRTLAKEPKARMIAARRAASKRYARSEEYLSAQSLMKKIISGTDQGSRVFREDAERRLRHSNQHLLTNNM